ncbi:hypothetical protein [Mycobacterium sp.]|uniref:hypothetical protein n=1 Tax=Mycobacterium sp. TaxID=1785 RepID=UPI0033407B78
MRSIMNAGGAVLAWALALQHPLSRPNEFLVYALADDNAEAAKKIERALATAKAGEFVCVPVRFMDMPDATNAYIQPHQWGFWCVVQRAVEVNQLFGGG